jgi:Flp pilus assembly protein TadG
MRTRNDEERGSVLTEMAVCIPVVLVILLGAVDFGRAWVHANATANAAHAGAQFGAQNIAHAGNTPVIEDVVMRDLKASSMMKSIADGDSSSAASFSVESERYCMCDGGNEVDCDSGNCGPGQPSQMHVRVRVNSTFEPLFDYPGLPDEIQIDRQASLRAR